MRSRMVPFCFLLFSISLLADSSSESWQDYRSFMRQFVQKISRYSKERNPEFLIIPQNGQELLTYNKWSVGEVVQEYMAAIDAVGREDLFFGYEEDDRETPLVSQEYMIPFLTLAKENGLEVLTIDYCSTLSHMDESYRRNSELGFLSFAADRRALDSIPLYPSEPYNISLRSIHTLKEAGNFLFLINPSRLSERKDLIETLAAGWYDVLIIDLFDNDGNLLSYREINRLNKKPNGESRLVIAYMSIGEAEDYRYYWKDQWLDNPPSWLDGENPHWVGNYKVKYWDPGWQELILGKEDSYLDLILEAGFNGVYLDLIDAFEYYESRS